MPLKTQRVNRIQRRQRSSPPVWVSFLEQITPGGIKLKNCKKCYKKKFHLNEFDEFNCCDEQVTSMANFELEYCKGGCFQRKDYLNEFNECNSCEKCRRCNNQRKDYLNEFQICDSCFKQKEQMTPSDFKPNVKFEYCKG